MRVTRWSISAVILVIALVIALLIPASRDVAVIASRHAAGSALSVLPGHRAHDSVGVISAERIAELHKDDPVILQGAAEVSRLDQSLELYERALKLKPEEPGLHAGIIRMAMWPDWTAKLLERQPYQPDPAARELLRIVEEHARWGMAHDPDNAYFYYAQACVDAALRRGDSAAKLYVAGSLKPRFEAYTSEATQAILTTNRARRMTRLQSQLQWFGSDRKRFVGAFDGASRRMAQEARRAETEGRHADALRMDMAVFRTGQLLLNNLGQGFRIATGFRIMLMAGPQVSKSELKAAMEAQHGRMGEVQLRLQMPLFAGYMLSHGLPKDEVSRMSDELRVAQRRAVAAASTDVLDRLFSTLGRADAAILLALLALYSALVFGILRLVLKPAVRLATHGCTEATGWSGWTSTGLWILLLTPFIALVVFLVRTPYAFWSFAHRMQMGGEIDSSVAVVLAISLLVVVTLVGLAASLIPLLRRLAARLPIRDTAVNAGVLAVLVVLETCWSRIQPGDMSGMHNQLAGGVQIAFAFVLIFCLLRGWIVARRNPGMPAAGHFLTSLVSSCRAVALGSVVLFVVSLYIALPVYLQAVRFLDWYITRGA